MKLLNDAIKKDIEHNYVQASNLYEEVIKQNKNLDAYLNLAVLYFQFTDYGINASSKLPLEFIKKAFVRYEEVIEECIKNFPYNSEAKFWRKYFANRVIDERLTADEIIVLLEKDNSSLVPYFYLFLLEPEKYKSERDKLFQICKKLTTAKNNWIISLIENN